MAKGKNQHVVPTDKGWGVMGDGNTRITRTFSTKAEAESFAKRIAQNQRAELIIHGKDGQIQNRNSYGNDPMPPKDQRG